MSCRPIRRIAAFAFAGALVAACGGSAPKPEPVEGAEGGSAASDETPKTAPKVKRAAVDAFKEAADAYKAGKLGGTEDALKEAIAEDAKFAQAYFNLGVVAEQQGKKDEARDWYKKALEKDPRFGDSLVNLAAMDADNGRRGEAASAFQQAVQVEPLNGYAHLNLAMESKGRKDYLDAVKRVRTALKEDSQNVDAYVVLAWTYYDMGKFELAKLVCLQAQTVSEHVPAVHNLLGLVHMKMADVTRAMAAFQKATEVDPNYLPALMNIGSITFSYRDYEASYRAFDQATKVAPQNLEAMQSKSVAARGMGNYEEAEKGYRAVIAADEKNTAAWFNLGVLQQEFLQKLPDAQKSYENVLRFEQSNANLRKESSERIKQVQIQIQNVKEAEEMMRQQAEEEKRNPPPPPAPAEPSAPAEPTAPTP